MRSRPSAVSRVYIHTLGCAKNEADSRAVRRSLDAAGAAFVSDPDDATHILLNTCGFIEQAKEESIDAILGACEQYPGRPILVMGCLVERYGDELAEGIPEVTAWFGLADRHDEPGLLDSLGLAETRTVAGQERPGRRGRGLKRPKRAVLRRAAYAYLKVSDGCGEPCTFCAIPAIKGPYRSVSTAQILREADKCLGEGAAELVLVGQDTSRWTSEGLDLTGLIDLLARDERLQWVRVMYLQPEGVTDTFLRCMSQQSKLCRYLDVPFQHSHPEVLRAMGRWGDGHAYLALLERARRLMPDVAVRSTFIVGFPGESEEHFEDLLRFVDKAGFDYAGGFVYSPEEGTPAAVLEPRVKRSVAEKRLNRLNALLGTRAEQERQRAVGSQVEVMVDSLHPEELDGDTTAVGRTAGQAPEVDGVTHIEGDLRKKTAPGDVVRVTLSAAIGQDLVGAYDAS